MEEIGARGTWYTRQRDRAGLGKETVDMQLDDRKFQPKAWPFLLAAGL